MTEQESLNAELKLKIHNFIETGKVFTDAAMNMKAMVNHLVAESVKAHAVLGTPPGSPMSLEESAARVMTELKQRRAAMAAQQHGGE